MFYQELRGRALDQYERLKASLIQLAKQQQNLTDDQLIVRTLRPQDLELTNPVWEFSITATDSFTSGVNAAVIDDNRWIGIAGISYGPSTELISQVRITKEGKTSREWNIQQINNFQDNIGWTDDPVKVEQNNTVTVDLYNYTTSTDTAHRIVFLGPVVEKKGLVFA